MATFDSWEVGICPDDDYLMHWGIPGMKHGRRRYQNEDGTWTSVGLAERRKREGFGENKKVAKAQKKIERAEKHQARKAARMEARQIRADKKRQKSLSGLTDEELQKKIARVKMEQEYKELTRSPLIKSGEHLFNSIMNYKDNKEKRVVELNRQKIEMERLKTQQVQARAATKQSKYQIKTSENEAKKSEFEAKKMKEDRKAGLKKKRKAELVDAKTRYKAESRGAIRTWLKNKANQSKEERERSFKLKEQDNNLQEQRERRANAEAIAKSNESQAKYKIDQERYKADQEKHKASQSASEQKWRETHELTEYEKERKKKK